MPKKFMKRYLPSPEKVQAMQSLSFLGDILHEPNLWHINRHSVARAFLVGIWFCFIPMPFQMLAAAFFAIWFNANLPLSVVLVWISNPVTMPPMFYFNYKIGAWAWTVPYSALSSNSPGPGSASGCWISAFPSISGPWWSQRFPLAWPT